MTLTPLPAGQQTVRRHNLSLLLQQLALRPGSRAELAQRTGLTKATVSTIVDALAREEIVCEAEPAGSGPGRPSRSVSFHPAGPAAVGIEINVDYIAVGVLDLTGRMRQYISQSLDNRSGTAEDILDRAAGLAADLVHNEQRLLGVALAIPGVVAATGQVLRAPNLSSLVGLPLGDLLAQRLEIPTVEVDNEANCAALARLWSGPWDGSNFVYVSGEIGVGAGLVLGGSLYRGAHGHAGELGHVTIERNGPQCGCGSRGCVEQYSGVEVILRASRAHDVAALVQALTQGRRGALAAVNVAGAALGIGLASMMNVIDVEHIVLGGQYATLFDWLAPPIEAELAERVLARGKTPILHRSPLGPDAALRGAAGSLLDRALREPDYLLSSAG